MKQYRLSSARIRKFRDLIYHYYTTHPRDLPWRQTRDPYKVLVSEFMLQQTQVDRVLDKYPFFISRFPTIASLAGAELVEVMEAWQGLGYNRRALSLQRCAHQIHLRFGGEVPADHVLLDSLPGIGPATASCILAFAFNICVPFIETNIRTVFLHHFFAHSLAVSDDCILPLVVQTADCAHPREWFWALMDYGVYLKKVQPNPSRRSAHHTRQSRFEGSDRQIRGEIIRRLVRQQKLNLRTLWRELEIDSERGEKIVMRMMAEGLLTKRGQATFWAKPKK